LASSFKFFLRRCYACILQHFCGGGQLGPNYVAQTFRRLLGLWKYGFTPKVSFRRQRLGYLSLRQFSLRRYGGHLLAHGLHLAVAQFGVRLLLQYLKALLQFFVGRLGWGFGRRCWGRFNYGRWGYPFGALSSAHCTGS
jgi:hypothetical protein